MPYFDRFDICDAYAQFASDYNVSGYTTGRRERFHGETNSDIFVRLHRMNYTPGHFYPGYADLSSNAKDIYEALALRLEAR